MRAAHPAARVLLDGAFYRRAATRQINLVPDRRRGGSDDFLYGAARHGAHSDGDSHGIGGSGDPDFSLPVGQPEDANRRHRDGYGQVLAEHRRGQLSLFMTDGHPGPEADLTKGVQVVFDSANPSPMPPEKAA